MNESVAWLLDIGGGVFAAIGERELVHLVPEPPLFAVPRMPVYCNRLLAWQGRLLPVWNNPAWVGAGARSPDVTIAAIVGYQLRRRERPQFGALLLPEVPRRVRVRDSQACELPADEPAWQAISASCFTYGERAVPILDLAAMFAAR